jgi:hypothetical protein
MKDRQTNVRRMSALVEKWRGSGRTLSAFARAEGMTRDKLEYWRRRLRTAPHRARRAGAGEEVAFAPVDLMPGSGTVPAVEVTLPDGVRLAIMSGETSDLIAAVIGALRRGC